MEEKEFWTEEYKSKLLSDMYNILGKPQVLDEMFYAFDEPIKYKSLTFYPVEMEFCMVFQLLATSLTLMKNLSGDINAVTKSYLDYLFYLAEKGEEDYLRAVEKVLLLCLRKDEYVRDENGEVFEDETQLDNKKRYIEYCLEKNKWCLVVGGDKFDGKDFDKIRKIICTQNSIEMPNEEIHPDKLEKIKEYEDYRAKHNNEKICSLEGQINILTIITGLSKKEIKGMSIRTFYNLLERYSILINYKLGTILSPNMEEKSRKEIQSWISEAKKQTKLEEITRSHSELASKFNGEGLMQNNKQ